MRPWEPNEQPVFFFGGKDKAAAERRKAGTGFITRWFGFKLLLVGLAGLMMLPSTLRYISQRSPLPFEDPAELLTIPHDTWVTGRVRLVLEEDQFVLKKLGRRKHSTPIAGTNRGVFYRWNDFKFEPESPEVEIEVNGRIEDADGWLESSWATRLRDQFREKDIELPAKLRQLKLLPPPSAGMILWRVCFHLLALWAVVFVIGRCLRGLRWGRDAAEMNKPNPRAPVDYTKGPPPL